YFYFYPKRYIILHMIELFSLLLHNIKKKGKIGNDLEIAVSDFFEGLVLYKFGGLQSEMANMNTFWDLSEAVNRPSDPYSVREGVHLVHYNYINFASSIGIKIDAIWQECFKFFIVQLFSLHTPLWDAKKVQKRGLLCPDHFYTMESEIICIIITELGLESYNYLIFLRVEEKNICLNTCFEHYISVLACLILRCFFSGRSGATIINHDHVTGALFYGDIYRITVGHYSVIRGGPPSPNKGSFLPLVTISVGLIDLLTRFTFSMYLFAHFLIAPGMCFS
ncbi:hypothetical protein ACJX0J_008726, partial [Zea mays]